MAKEVCVAVYLVKMGLTKPNIGRKVSKFNNISIVKKGSVSM